MDSDVNYVSFSAIMSNPNLKNISSFGQAAVKLDCDFSELDRISEQVSRLTLESESDMEQAQHLLLKFGEYGQQIAEGIQNLARALEEKRNRAENAAKRVAEQATHVEARHHEKERLFERYRVLHEMALQANQSLSQLKIPDQLSEVEALLKPLLEEAHQLKLDAQASKMKTIEKSADALWQSLESARRKLNQAASSLGFH